MTDAATDEAKGEGAPAPRVRRIVVRGLFGLYDHDIPLSDDPRVTIIHGPNGVGKTTVLRLVDAMLRRVGRKLTAAPFESAELKFDTGAVVEVDGSDTSGSPRPYWHEPGGISATPHPIVSGGLLGVDRLNPKVARKGIWADKAAASAVQVMRERIVVDFLQAQAHYGAVSQDLDQSFVARLLSGAVVDADGPSLAARAAAVELEHQRLADLGLVDGPPAAPIEPRAFDQLDPGRRAALALNLTDALQKLAAWAPFADRLTLLLRHVGGKLLHKSIRFDREVGLRVVLEKHEDLPLDALSSGEQHELVLSHALLFDVKPNTLVLIDEPELSLHVLWQKRFIDELIEITRLVGFDALVATHSPFIIGAHDDLLVDLDPRLATPGAAR